MRDETIGTFLDKLAARLPAPGGGAAAALSAAQGAALISMVARYSDGPRYTEHAATIGGIIDAAERLRAECLEHAAADAAAFAAVAEAYKLPRGTDQERAVRSVAIADALAAAAEPQAAVIAAAGQLIGLAEALLPVGNPNVITDVAAAAESGRAAAAIARLNVEVNLSGITDAAERGRYADAVAAVGQLLARADQVTADVRAKVAG